MAFVKKPTLLDRYREGRYKPDTSLELKMRREEIVAGIKIHPWALFTAKDVDGSPLLRTVDRRPNGQVEAVRAYPHEREYLKVLVYELIDPQNVFIVVIKTRQVMFSFTSLLSLGMWDLWVNPYSEMIVSRTKEESAIKLVREKMFDTWAQFPPWFKEQMPLVNRPREMFRFGNHSHILAVSQNFPDSESRGDSAKTVLVDEAPVQQNLPRIITSTLPMAGKIVIAGTSAQKGEGKRIYQHYIDKAKRNQTTSYMPCPGMTITKASMSRGEDGEPINLCLIEAFPPEMKQTNKAWLHINRSAYEQEMEGNWQGTEGQAYYPEFNTYGGKEFYHSSMRELPRGVEIHRGFDFGVKRPACTWAIVDKEEKRIHVLYDLLGQDIDPWSWIRVVRYLSGEISIEEAIKLPKDFEGTSNPVAEVLDNLAKTSREGPWFAPSGGTIGIPPIKFINHGGHEANYKISQGALRKPQTYASIFQDHGIVLIPRYSNKDRRELVIRHLLMPRGNGRPSLTIDCENAPILSDGFASGLVRPKTEVAARAEEPVHDDYYHDVYDSFGYIAVDEFGDEQFDTWDFSEVPMTRDSPNSVVGVGNRGIILPESAMTRGDDELNDIDRLWRIGR